MEDAETTTATNPLASLHRARRPAAVLGWVGALYIVGTAPLAIANMGQNWGDVSSGLAVWLALFLVAALPVAGLGTILAARVERAATGLRHPQRAGWSGVALGAMLLAHWAVHLVWAPLLFLMAMGENHRREEHLVGAVLALMAWGFAAGGIYLSVWSARHLRQRDWTGVDALRGPRRLPRLPTPILGACVWLFSTGLGSLAVGAVSAEQHEPVLGVMLWGMAGVATIALGAAYGSWVYRGLPHNGAQGGWSRFIELAGAAWMAHWLPFFVTTLFTPMWGSNHHDAQLVAAVLVAIAISIGTACWSWGRELRLSSG
jgi:hypothetical protein